MQLKMIITNATDEQLKEIINKLNKAKINDWSFDCNQETLDLYHKQNGYFAKFDSSFNTSIVDVHDVVLKLSEEYKNVEFIVEECLNLAESDLYSENEDKPDPDYFMRTYAYHKGNYKWEFNMANHPMIRAEDYEYD